MNKRIFDSYVICSDMDGTFLGNDSILLQNNLQAIKFFTENGGVFTLATGRCKNAVRKLFPDVTNFVNGPSIICGGSYLYDFSKDEMFFEKDIPYEVCENIVNRAKDRFPNLGVRISTEEGFVCPVTSPFLLNGLKSTPGIIVSYDIEYLKNTKIHKIVYTGEKDVISKFSEYILPYIHKDLNVTKSSNTIFEILPFESSKGLRLKDLRSFLGEEKTYICVGDYMNDLDMLTVCDLPACPDNACDKVKRISKFHLCNNNEGCIADLIYKLQNISLRK